MPMTDDERWAGMLRTAIRGDERVYAEFLSEITPVLRRLVRSRADRLAAADCEDVVQEAMLAIHLKRHTWRQEEPLRPWLFAIARYKIIDAFRARGKRIELPVEDYADVLPAEETEDATVQGDMERVLATLDGRAGEIVRAIGVEGASVADVGSRFSMTEGAVRVALHRGLKKLAEMRTRMLE
jgi:RNA polymerase sigma-70 factor (ECF subfamily)